MRGYFFLLTLLATGCVFEDEPSTSTWNGAPSYEEWREQWPQLSDGRYVVEGDMLFPEDKLRALYDRYYPDGQGLTIDVTFFGNWNDWDPPTRYDLTYCISNDFGSWKPAVYDALKYASIGWESGGDINFRYVPAQDANCTDQNNAVVFNVIPVPALPDGAVAMAFRPDDLRPQRHLQVAVGADGNSGPFMGEDQKHRRHTMRHELGHILGFLHEFYNDAVQGTGSCTGDDNGQVVSGPDSYSVMMYSALAGCPHDPLWFFTEWDLEGAGYVYGPPLGYDVVSADYDGDLYMDLAVRFGRGGNWCIKFSSDDLSDEEWSLCVEGYGTSAGPNTSQVAVGNYDNDLRADISVKDDPSGTWYIDYAADGFNGWNIGYGGRGGTWAKVTPADYDGDGRTDLSVKDNNGYWHIDYSGDGFAAWNIVKSGYGNNTDSIPVPGKYNADAYADLAVRESSTGRWRIDFASWVGYQSISNGYNGYNVSYPYYGFAGTVPVPSDYDGDGILDLSIKDDVGGQWFIDHSSDGFSGWNVVTPALYGDSKWKPMPGRWEEVPLSSRGDLAVKRVNSDGIVKSWWYVNFRSDWYDDSYDETHVLLQ